MDWGRRCFLQPFLSVLCLMLDEGTKTVDEEMVRQLRQNNIGPAEMLFPLASVSKRQDFADAIESKQKAHPELSISGGGSIFDMLTFNEYFGGLDKYNLDKGRFQAFFVYNRATSRGDLWDRCGIRVPMIMSRHCFVRFRWTVVLAFFGIS